jgi:hypothetical protein
MKMAAVMAFLCVSLLASMLASLVGLVRSGRHRERRQR